MFDPLLELKRRRQMGVPQVQGNILPPDVGPDMQAAPPPPPMQMMAPAPMGGDGPNFGGLAELGAERGMTALMKKLKPEKTGDALASLPVLKNLFRR